jgi:hypothetical protein
MFVGADTDQLRVAASRFAALAEQVRVLATTCDSGAEAIVWEGPDAVAFRAASARARQLAELVASLIEASVGLLTKNASEQEEVSASLSPRLSIVVDDTVQQVISDFRDFFGGDEPPQRQFEAAEVRASVRKAIEGTELDRQDVQDALERARPWDLDVINSFRELGMSDADFIEFLKGGHVVLPQSNLYDTWAVENGVTDRISSHYGGQAADGTSQHGHYGELFKEMLFGKNADGTTWVQLEAHAASDWKGHSIDYIEYQLDDNNQGPWGESSHTDQDPIVIRQSVKVDVRERFDSDPSYA